MKTTLLIMAAGIGSRFGNGIKQLTPVDTSCHVIMDYSIHDAIEAGFNKIVFIIRTDIKEEFEKTIGKRIEKICAKFNVKVDYVFQDLSDIPGKLPIGRSKPWGTGQAVLAAKDIIDTPFAVINADDYYGKEAFYKIHESLVSGNTCMVGFILKNTLSENGGVTRGICKTKNGLLSEIIETSDIVKTERGIIANGVLLDDNSCVSMNMWGLMPEFMRTLEKGFIEFFKEKVPFNPLLEEYLLPIYIGELLEKNMIEIKIVTSKDKWFGVTYIEDRVSVVQSFKKLINTGVYKEDLFSDL